MSFTSDDTTALTARAALAWLIEMGDDTIVLETAPDRLKVLAPAPVPAPATQKPFMADRISGMLRPANLDLSQIHTLEALAAELAKLDHPLKKTATNLVFYDGNPKADLMMIGEAPGREEDLSGTPFVGRSGQLLDRILAAIGRDRANPEPGNSVFITNTLYWRPPGNRTPTDAETQATLPFLLRTIEIVAPKIILCLGATPAQRLLEKTGGISSLRGRWHSLAIGGTEIPLMATFHPAYLLRQPAQKRLVWHDCLMVQKKLAETGAR